MMRDSHDYEKKSEAPKGAGVVTAEAKTKKRALNSSSLSSSSRAPSSPREISQNLSPQAKRLLKKGERGSTYAQNELGFCYEYGARGIKKDETQARLWYEKAAKRGHAIAQYNLGRCYYYGIGVSPMISKDAALQEAVKWYRKAANQGLPDAQNSLGVCYERGEGVADDVTEAMEWYKKAALQGCALAQFNLGDCYYHGVCVEENESTAITWYRKAARQGDADAQYALGICYEQGQGTPVDKAESIKWYGKAAQQFKELATQSHISSYAQYALAECYRYGRGVTQNKLLAIEWYQKAAAQGHKLAKKDLDSYKQEQEEINTDKVGKRQKRFSQSSLNLKRHREDAPTSEKEKNEKSQTEETNNEDEEPIIEKRKKKKNSQILNDDEAEEVKEEGVGAEMPTRSFSSVKKDRESDGSSDNFSDDDKPLIERTGLAPTMSARRSTKSTGNSQECTHPGGSFVVMEKEFKPIIPPSGLDYSKVGFFKAKFERKENKDTLEKSDARTQCPSIPQTQLSDKAKMDIGRWGEECVYKKLKYHYSKKYSPAKITETPSGFTLVSKEHDIEIVVKWHNKIKESEKPMDFELTKTKRDGVKKRYIEVKTTTAKGAHTAYLSGDEFQQMLKHQEEYSIFRVFNAGKNNNIQIDKIRNPLKKVLDGEMLVGTVELKI